jgi:broad specificity phosphatase PhoE
MNVAPARLLVVRHAHIECGRNGLPLLCGSHDAPLSPRGQKEVERLRRRLAEVDAVALYSSPLTRAVHTAAAAPGRLQRSMRLLNSLAEIHCGVVEGMAIADAKQLFAEAWDINESQSDEQFRWPGGESYRRFRNRVLRAIRAIARVHTGQTVLIVTHAGVVNQVLGSLHGQSAARWENFRPGNASITELLWSGATGRVIYFDDRSHLQEKHRGAPSQLIEQR